jgi:CheY-like chemotaxis protein
MARLQPPPSNFSDVLTISEAADFLGVSTATLRNWDRSGKLKPRRHPQNGYRIYLHEDLEAVLRSADLSTLTEESFVQQVDWDKLRDSEHFVQFYENDELLIESASGFIGAALRDGGTGVVAATPDHRSALDRKLAARGVDVAEAQASGRYVVLDARETLSRFMAGSSVDPKRFDEVIGSAIGRILKSGQRLHAFGEMVALLWADGNREAAIELEQLWNKLASQLHFSLLCAYPLAGFNGSDSDGGIQDVCSCHSRVLPAESYATADTEEKRLRAITLLQQKAQSLAAEIEHRGAVEKALSSRERELADFFENGLEGLDPQSEGPGKGSEFNVQLPAAKSVEKKSRTQTARKDKETATSTFRVLVVDDNHDSGHTLGLLLKIKGHEVRTAGDGLEAIAVAEEFRPDIILMDVGMPKLDGYEATRRLRETPFGKDVMIVALTGWGQASDIARSVEAGCSAHLVKPVDFAGLERLLATAKK